MAKRETRKAYNSHHNLVKLNTGEFQRADGMFAYRYTGTDGKKKTIYSSTIEGLRAKEKELNLSVAVGLKSTGQAKTLDTVYGEWKEVKRGIREHTMNNYTWLYEQYVLGNFGKKLIKNLSSVDIRRFYNSLCDEQHLAVSTVDGLHTVLHQVFEVAVEQRYIRTNPATKAMAELRKVRGDNMQKHKALSQDEQKRFLSFLRNTEENKKWYAPFAVMVGTGLRAGELTGLRWCDVDFENNTIDVNHCLIYYSDKSSGQMEFQINPPKSKAGKRTITMFDFVKQALLEERERQKANHIKCESVIDGYTDFIFLNRHNEVQHYGTLNKALRRIIRDANFEALEQELVLLPRFSCHNLRSTYCTRLAEHGVPLKIAMKLMGHDDMRTTTKIYTTVNPDWEKRELQAVNDALNAQLSIA